MPTPPLPALAAAPVSAGARLAYVLAHLRLAYPGVPAGSIGYAASQPLVVVAELDASFFEGQHPYPPAPHWREWGGRQLPFFFDEGRAELLVLQENQVVVTADIISAAFYLLSGWQEYFSDERDRHGRFPYAASVQKQYDFVALPVVNYYFEVLKTALEHVSGQRYPPRRWGPAAAPFAAFISHDVDNMRSAWKAPAKAALRQGRWLNFGRQLWRHLTQPDAWDNLEDVAAQVAQYGGRSTFFILPEHRKAVDGTPNADYRLTKRLQQRLGKLERQGYELGLHGSIGTSTHAMHLFRDMHQAHTAVGIGDRFHYLSWEPRCTPDLLAISKTSYDSTLGFAEHYGFRYSYCLPFHPFNFADGQAYTFLEIPLNIMDATLHHPHYLRLAPAEILPALQPVFSEIKRFGGVASILWHNENFDPANERNGPRQFHELMAQLRQQGAAFLTGREIWQEFTAEPAAPAPPF